MIFVVSEDPLLYLFFIEYLVTLFVVVLVLLSFSPVSVRIVFPLLV